MKQLLGLLVMLLTMLLVGIPRAADISGLPWNQSNIAKLRELSKDDLLEFFNQERRNAGVVLEPLTANEIGQFEWADLANDGQYELVLTLFEPCTHAVEIEKRDASGNVTTVQTIEGLANLKTGIRDLDGDGKDELVIGKTLAEYSCASIVTWPAVYRLENGKYVEASRDFPAFYDDEVLPKLDAEIKQYRAKEVKAGAIDQWNPAGFIMARDKILRVLGRDPTAGLKQANDWMNSSDPQLAFYAAAMFKDIGGHEQDAKAAEVSYRRAKCKRHPGLAMCRAAAPN